MNDKIKCLILIAIIAIIAIIYSCSGDDDMKTGQYAPTPAERAQKQEADKSDEATIHLESLLVNKEQVHSIAKRNQKDRDRKLLEDMQRVVRSGK